MTDPAISELEHAARSTFSFMGPGPGGRIEKCIDATSTDMLDGSTS
jgi:hypothetical protein